jgi:DNA-binding NarL/FixJ family response regulator
MRLFLVDDHALFLEGLRNLLLANGFEVVGTAAGGWEALAGVESCRPDVVLLDVQMPEMDGVETTRLMKGKYPNLKIVMLTISQDDRYLFEAIKAGASGYLLKGLEKEKFLELLRGIADGESPLSPGLAGRIMAEFARRENQRSIQNQAHQKLSESLTPRQTEILGKVAQGMTYKEIGAQLNISEAAVKYHMGEITSRLQLENRAQVVAYAAGLGLGLAAGGEKF